MTGEREGGCEPFTVDGKTAIVTGAGSGIGLAFTTLLLSRNCNVVLADLTLRPEACALVDKYTPTTTNHPRAKAIFIEADVTSWPSLRNLFTKTLTHFPESESGFDILCPCAGVFEPPWSSFWYPPDSSPASRDTISESRYATLDINLTHPIRLTQMALGVWMNSKSPTPTKQTPRRVIIVSSVAAQLPLFSNPLYGASKAAVSSFVRSMAPLDDAVGVRVNAVAPGLIKTPLWTDHPEKMAYVDEEGDVWATPDEVASVMMKCVEEDGPDVKGGSVIEVGHDHERVVGIFGDPGPDLDPKSGKGLSVGKGKVGWEDAMKYVPVPVPVPVSVSS
ncbi:short chain dehydrogenase [Apodospora peruviana]|uniref:Short chain dehydrogenase n=1 Tax=Apodospora peruviana TaxID=516989 RepID=A0AAE0HX61_9PEZI|nr:short chain dehydrogenase [Apodospora peruviana]